MAQCKGTRKDGNRCRSSVVLANGYCSAHQDQAKKASFKTRSKFSGLNKPFYWVLLGAAIIGACGVIIAAIIQRCGSNHQTVVVQSSITEADKQDIVNKLAKTMVPKLNKQHDSASVVGIHRQGFIVPTGYVSNNFAIDWNKAKVIKFSPPELINFEIPDFEYLPNHIKFSGISVILKKPTIGKKYMLSVIGKARLFAQILSMTNKDLVTIGLIFEEEKP
jgi:hypothetical protein